jgi:hypothetical protein
VEQQHLRLGITPPINWHTVKRTRVGCVADLRLFGGGRYVFSPVPS